MTLQDVLGKMRKADKIVVKDEKGEIELFHGNVIQCSFMNDLADREVELLYPEMLGGLIVKISSNRKTVARKDIYETN